MPHESTICAISTPPGNGAIAVIRLSGPEAIQIADQVFIASGNRKQLIGQPANTIHHGFLKDGKEEVDEVLVSLFRAPHSYSGEDLVEVSCHGSEYIQQKVLELFIRKGARLAKPGEFTMRAFLNGKMDLSQAEAVADLIVSDSEATHRVALKQMKGGFSSEIARLREKLLNFISLLELELDFSEEEVEFANRKQLQELLQEIESNIGKLAGSFKDGNVMKNGIPTAIAGKTNVGKSTLLNAILKDDRAIVSEIEGTTRDVIEDVVFIEGLKFRFIDTAGLRKSSDTIEKLGIEKALAKIDKAYIVLYLLDATKKQEELDRLIGKIKQRLTGKDQKLLLLFNKTDLLAPEKIKKLKDINIYQNLSRNDHCLYISAREQNTGDLLKQLAKLAKPDLGKNDVVVTNVRHYEALTKAREAVNRALKGMDTALPTDLLAMDIREVLYHLGEITGEVSNDEILGNIFKNFCVGK